MFLNPLVLSTGACCLGRNQEVIRCSDARNLRQRDGSLALHIKVGRKLVSSASTCRRADADEKESLNSSSELRFFVARRDFFVYEKTRGNPSWEHDGWRFSSSASPQTWLSIVKKEIGVYENFCLRRLNLLVGKRPISEKWNFQKMKSRESSSMIFQCSKLTVEF